jgi:hypothetical protein
MSNATEYAEEAMLSASQSKTDNERQAQLDLARTWTQAALRREVTISDLKPSSGRYTGL